MNMESSDTREHMTNYAGKILSMADLAEHPFYQHEQPTYTFILEKGNKKLVYIGVPHSNKPEHPLFAEIQDKFNELQPNMVLFEGRRYVNAEKEKYANHYKSETLEETKNEGEPTFVLKLAVDAGIDFESPEPSFQKEINHLIERGFSQKDIYTYYMYRVIYQYQRSESSLSVSGCREYLQKYMERFRSDSQWNVDLLIALETDMFAEIGTGDNGRFKRMIDPIVRQGKEYTAVNKISAESGLYRDIYIFERITEGLKKYNKVLIVYGSAHAVVQEPALRAYFEKEV